MRENCVANAVDISTVIPVDMITTIKDAPSSGDNFPVIGQTVFSQRILKAKTITFDVESQLIFENTDDYIVLVAKTINVAAPVGPISVIVDTLKWQQGPNPRLPALSDPAQRAKVGIGQDGLPGLNGSAGIEGNRGADGRRVPTLYILAGEIVLQPGAPKPSFLDLTIRNVGVDGQDGADGQDGQAGGDGGDGGDSDWHDPLSYPGDPGCKASAGNGGPGGWGGLGADGGLGGRGSKGGDLILGGSEAAIKDLGFAKPVLDGGAGGRGGRNGRSGRGGRGGARGAHFGNCSGGRQDYTVRTPYTAPQRAKDGDDGAKGIIQTWSVDVETLF